MTDMFPRAAGYVDRILRGEKPPDLPVQTPTRNSTSVLQDIENKEITLWYAANDGDDIVRVLRLVPIQLHDA